MERIALPLIISPRRTPRVSCALPLHEPGAHCTLPGKQVALGYDNEGRPCLYLLPNKQNTKNSPKQVEHLVYMLERTLDISPPGQETLALLIDFRNSSAGSQPSIGTGRQVLNILQNHYPERLGRALITHCEFSAVLGLLFIVLIHLSALVRHYLPQAHLPLHRPHHKDQNSLQRAPHRSHPRLATHEECRRRNRLRVRPQRILASPRQVG
jgi:hypothetical protein